VKDSFYLIILVSNTRQNEFLKNSLISSLIQVDFSTFDELVWQETIADLLMSLFKKDEK